LGSRRTARVLTLQALYQYDIGKRPLDELLKFNWTDVKYNEKTIEFAKELICGTVENLEEIDSKIKEQLEHWDFNRLSYIDRAILRFSTYSILYRDDIPDTVAIDEAVEIAKAFGTDDSYRFVNGVLDAIRRKKEEKMSGEKRSK